jgi:hypothetical protein
LEDLRKIFYGNGSERERQRDRETQRKRNLISGSVLIYCSQESGQSTHAFARYSGVNYTQTMHPRLNSIFRTKVKKSNYAGDLKKEPYKSRDFFFLKG